MATRWNRKVCGGLLCLVLGWSAAPAQADLLWNWSYSGAGISANGTFTTTDATNGSGQYSILGITGTRNGVTITGLQSAGTAIPGNAPFDVDNLLSATGPHLTGSGFGYSLADGTYANPYFAAFLASPTVLEFLSVAPFVSSFLGPEDKETPVTFSASLVQVPPAVQAPEPAGLALVAVALAAMQLTRRNSRSGAAAA